MIQLARQCQADTLHIIDQPYRLSSWALDDPQNIALWVDEAGHLIAWSVMQTPFWTIDYVISPHLENVLHPKVLAWVDQRASEAIASPYGHPSWYVNLFADQPERISTLEHFGFTSQADAGEDSWSMVWMERSRVGKIPQPSLPNGFSIRPLAGKGEVADYVELHQAVFETKNMTLEWRSRTLEHPDYHPDLDLVVIAPDGRMVAFCIGWLSPNPDGEYFGQIEPLGSHADFRKYGLGRAVLCEVLRRLQEHGAERIFVETDNDRKAALRLYEGVGFLVTREVRVYRKDYNHG